MHQHEPARHEELRICGDAARRMEDQIGAGPHGFPHQLKDAHVRLWSVQKAVFKIADIQSILHPVRRL